MRRRGMPEAHNAHPNVTPLIDVVMCLIIFFMLIAKIGVSTGAEEMVIPATFKGVDIKQVGNNTLVLNVRPGPGGGGAGDEPVITALVEGSKQELKVSADVTKKQLAEVLKTFRYGPSKRPGSYLENPDFAVIIRGEESLEYRYLEPVLMAAAEAGVRTVAFNTRTVTVRAP